MNGVRRDRQGASGRPEQRTHPRYDVELEVGLAWSESNFYVGLTANISEGGLFISTHELRPVGSQIDVSLKLPDHLEPIRTTAVVRWQRVYSKTSDADPGIGVQFVSLAPEHLEAIRRFLSKRAPLFFEQD
jgi:uncharacterized protein (TIGR02266 family)